MAARVYVPGASYRGARRAGGVKPQPAGYRPRHNKKTYLGQHRVLSRSDRMKAAILGPAMAHSRKIDWAMDTAIGGAFHGMGKRHIPGETPVERFQRHQKQVASGFTAAAAVPALLALRAGMKGSRALAQGDLAAQKLQSGLQLRHAATATALGGLSGASLAVPPPRRYAGRSMSPHNPKRRKMPKPRNKYRTGVGRPSAPGYVKDTIQKGEIMRDAFGVARPDLDIDKAVRIANPAAAMTRLTKPFKGGFKGFTGGLKGTPHPAPTKFAAGARSFGSSIRAHPFTAGAAAGGVTIGGAAAIHKPRNSYYGKRDEPVAKITAAQRSKLKSSQFGLPGKAKGAESKKQSGNYPIDTPGRARAALSYSARFASSAEQAQIRRRVHDRYPGIGKALRPTPSKNEVTQSPFVSAGRPSVPPEFNGAFLAERTIDGRPG